MHEYMARSGGLPAALAGAFDIKIPKTKTKTKTKTHPSFD